METCHRPGPTLAARDDLLSSTVVEPPSLGSVMSGFSSQIESTISVLGLWDRQTVKAIKAILVDATLLGKIQT
jgi:hypothetical protein